VRCECQIFYSVFILKRLSKFQNNALVLLNKELLNQKMKSNGSGAHAHTTVLGAYGITHEKRPDSMPRSISLDTVAGFEAVT